MISQSVITVGTTPVTVVEPTIDAAHYTLKNLEPDQSLGDYSRKGYVYTVSQYFSISNNGNVYFSFLTGATGAQFNFWNFASSTSSVIGYLVQGATITTTGSAIPGRNLNRNFSTVS